MNTDLIRDYVTRYLEATDCQVIERHPAFVTVKLSPEADKALTNRPYYWSFVERTGADPETMSLTFVFDQELFDKLNEEKERTKSPPAAQLPANSASSGAQPSGSPSANSASANTDHTGQSANSSILARYFGISGTAVHQRVRHETITFGSGRLNQIFESARSKGMFVHLYEQPQGQAPAPGRPASYTSYLGVNYKIEYLCDIKRDELHSLGICLSTGDIIEQFHERLGQLPLSPKLPALMHTNDMLSLPRAVSELESHVERLVKAQDHSWASQAEERMYDELHRIKLYYQEMIQNSNDEEEKQQMQDEYRMKQEEIAWQFKPRVLVTAINCGVFHLLSPVRGERKMANPPLQ